PCEPRREDIAAACAAMAIGAQALGKSNRGLAAAFFANGQNITLAGFLQDVRLSTVRLFMFMAYYMLGNLVFDGRANLGLCDLIRRDWTGSLAHGLDDVIEILSKPKHSNPAVSQMYNAMRTFEDVINCHQEQQVDERRRAALQYVDQLITLGSAN
ncbi:hypothetical protein FDECE_18176, partial [Fusarium decemcellulare]